jgi:hypothetical protein
MGPHGFVLANQASPSNVFGTEWWPKGRLFRFCRTSKVYSTIEGVGRRDLGIQHSLALPAENETKRSRHRVEKGYPRLEPVGNTVQAKFPKHP